MVTSAQLHDAFPGMEDPWPITICPALNPLTVKIYLCCAHCMFSDLSVEHWVYHQHYFPCQSCNAEPYRMTLTVR